MRRRFSPRRRRRLGFRIFALAVVAGVLGGVGNGVENVAADTTLQRIVERRMLGRVFGVFYGGVMLAESLGAALGGLLLRFTSPPAAFIAAGAGTLAFTLLVWALLRSDATSIPRAPG